MLNKRNIRNYLQILNPSYEDIDSELIEFTIDETLDRVILYLNNDNLPSTLERIIANVINTGLKKCIKDMDSDEVDHAVKSISDNGQSITYDNEITRYFSTTSDEELFSGFTPVLNRYRRIKVVHSKEDEK